MSGIAGRFDHHARQVDAISELRHAYGLYAREHVGEKMLR
jgi:hypothetical protein